MRIKTCKEEGKWDRRFKHNYRQNFTTYNKFSKYGYKTEVQNWVACTEFEGVDREAVSNWLLDSCNMVNWVKFQARMAFGNAVDSETDADSLWKSKILQNPEPLVPIQRELVAREIEALMQTAFPDETVNVRSEKA